MEGRSGRRCATPPPHSCHRLLCVASSTVRSPIYATRPLRNRAPVCAICAVESSTSVLWGAWERPHCEWQRGGRTVWRGVWNGVSAESAVGGSERIIMGVRVGGVKGVGGGYHICVCAMYQNGGSKLSAVVDVGREHAEKVVAPAAGWLTATWAAFQTRATSSRGGTAYG